LILWGFFVGTECNSALLELKFNYCNLIYLLNFKKSKIMKNQNYLMTGLAIVGAISLFIMACSAAETNNSNNNNSATGIGKYQITDTGNTASGAFHVIDTETGIVKTFSPSGGMGYQLSNTTITQ